MPNGKNIYHQDEKQDIDNSHLEPVAVAELLRTCSKIGVEKTIAVLRGAQKSKIEWANSETEFTVTKVSEITCIPTSEIMNGKGRSNDRKFAIGLCCHFLKHVFGFEMIDIQVLMQKHFTNCHKYYKQVNNLSKKIMNEAKFIEYKETLSELITKKTFESFKTSNN